MMVLELDLAIYRRLTGFPLDSQGKPLLGDDGVPVNREIIGPPDLNLFERVWDEVKGEFTSIPPLLPSYGIRIPLMKSGYKGQQGLTSLGSSALPVFGGFEENAFKQVPVFDQNLSGRKIEDIWPCVTFRWFDMDFDPSVFVYHDPFQTPNTQSLPVDLKDRDGTTIQSGYEENLVRPHPESWPVSYVITVHAKTPIELALICNEVIRMFPARGAITVEFASGEKHTCDMLLLRTENLDEGNDRVPMTRGPEEQRGFSRAFVYIIESYVDNTVNKFGVRDTRSVVAVRERLLEMDRVMDGLAHEESNEDLNLGELEPLTA